MMTGYISSTVGAKGRTYASAANNIDSMMSLNNGYCMFMLDGRHRPCSDELLKDGTDVEWSVEPLSMLYGFGVHCEPNFPTQTITLSKATTISTAIVRRETKLTDRVETLLSYVQALEEYYIISFVDMRIMDTVEDIRSTDLLASNYKTTNIRHIRVGKMIFQHQIFIYWIGTRCSNEKASS